MPDQQPDMTAAAVLALVRLFAANGIEVCLDGGWAVDAQLGRQTRPHADLDIVIPHHLAERLRALLTERGYHEVPRDDSWECNFVLGDGAGHQVDVHTCEFDAAGNLIYGLAYPADSLRGSGAILEQPVRCITAQWLVQFHTGYKLDAADYQDVKALCQVFGIPLPAEYAPFEQAESAG